MGRPAAPQRSRRCGPAHLDCPPTLPRRISRVAFLTRSPGIELQLPGAGSKDPRSPGPAIERCRAALEMDSLRGVAAQHRAALRAPLMPRTRRCTCTAAVPAAAGAPSALKVPSKPRLTFVGFAGAAGGPHPDGGTVLQAWDGSGLRWSERRRNSPRHPAPANPVHRQTAPLAAVDAPGSGTG